MECYSCPCIGHIICSAQKERSYRICFRTRSMSFLAVRDDCFVWTDTIPLFDAGIFLVRRSTGSALSSGIAITILPPPTPALICSVPVLRAFRSVRYPAPLYREPLAHRFWQYTSEPATHRTASHLQG